MILGVPVKNIFSGVTWWGQVIKKSFRYVIWGHCSRYFFEVWLGGYHIFWRPAKICYFRCDLVGPSHQYFIQIWFLGVPVTNTFPKVWFGRPKSNWKKHMWLGGSKSLFLHVWFWEVVISYFRCDLVSPSHKIISFRCGLVGPSRQ